MLKYEDLIPPKEQDNRIAELLDPLIEVQAIVDVVEKWARSGKMHPGIACLFEDRLRVLDDHVKKAYVALTHALIYHRQDADEPEKVRQQMAKDIGRIIERVEKTEEVLPKNE